MRFDNMKSELDEKERQLKDARYIPYFFFLLLYLKATCYLAPS